jgi:hypothetical protein
MGRLLQFFYSANGSWQVFQQLFLSTSDAGILGNPAVSGNSRDFSVFAPRHRPAAASTVSAARTLDVPSIHVRHEGKE